MTFEPTYSQNRWEDVKQKINAASSHEVLLALNKKDKRSIDDFCALISPAAAPYLEQMAQLSQTLTQQRFGKVIQLYIPLYLSNECQNICTYCGFSFDNKLKRITLTDQQILEEVKVIKSMGYNHVLLVTGEANKTVGVEYLKNAIELIRPYFSHISIEVQPLEQEEYSALSTLGLNTVLVYQETYNQEAYKKFHPKGKKSNFEYRLETPDRLGRADIHKIGLGFLIGLEDWRTEAFFIALHLKHLEKKYWKTKYAISFPRLRPASGVESSNIYITDKELVQLICAYRIFNQDVELSLSTRETAAFRDHVFQLGITSMSAGSRTNPGGYSSEKESLEQFEVSDERSSVEISNMIKSKGYEPVWKDWDAVFSTNKLAH